MRAGDGIWAGFIGFNTSNANWLGLASISDWIKTTFFPLGSGQIKYSSRRAQITKKITQMLVKIRKSAKKALRVLNGAK